MSKAKHKCSSGLTGVSILPEAEHINQAHPRSCSNGKEQTNTEPDEALMNRQAGATRRKKPLFSFSLGRLQFHQLRGSLGQMCQRLLLV